MRRATLDDLPAIQDILNRHIETSMFPLSNLERHGLDGDHARSMRYWIGDRGVFGITKAGMLMPQMPNGTDVDWAFVGNFLAERVMIGAVGDDHQISKTLVAADLQGIPTLTDRVEPQFSLNLSDLIVPHRPDATLVTLGEEYRQLATAWRADFCAEVMNTPDPESQARRDISGHIERGQHRILLLHGKPVAMTGFNAALPQIVQVGGVYTPPEFRNKGFARLAVALHLAEARNQGTPRAILGAANDAATRAYEAIGFQRCGDFRLALFAKPKDTAA